MGGWVRRCCCHALPCNCLTPTAPACLPRRPQVMSPTILTWMIAELSVVYDKNSPLRSLPEQFGAAQVA